MTTEVTVIIPTHNRAEILRTTLAAKCPLSTTSSTHSFIGVDNNSTDSTPAVVASFDGKLCVQYLVEATPGKNAALNAGVEECSLGKFMVFSHDEVASRRYWLDCVVSSADLWSDFSVLGREIEAILPMTPKWSASQLAFSKHEPRKTQGAYDAQPTSLCPKSMDTKTSAR